MECVSLSDLAGGVVAAGVGQTGGLPALGHRRAVKHLLATILQVVYHVVDVECADAAHQARGHRCFLLYTVGRLYLKYQ